jgi:hypothetical protein
MPDPSLLDAATYASKDDYGVIARVTLPHGTPVFVIARLGGRATEGSSRYFVDHWHELHRHSGSDYFALVLRFPAPFRVESAQWAASAT